MSTKGNQTKHFICEEAYKLFAKKGFKDVTMKDICEKMQQEISAVTILNDVLSLYEKEMSDTNSSLPLPSLIVFSYQSVRMYGTIMKIDKDISKRIITQIRLLLLAERKGK